MKLSVLEWVWADMERIDQVHRVADKYRRLGMSEARVARLVRAMTMAQQPV